MAGSEIDEMIRLLARLPGLGPRSARRAALHLMRRHDTLLVPLAEAMTRAADTITTCSLCNTLDTTDPCAICADTRRDRSTICVVEQVADQWALERSGSYHGLYHVLGGTLSALDGVGPDDLAISSLVNRARAEEVSEVILALNATVDGQTTAHYVADRLTHAGVTISRLAHGLPVGGELDYLDDGTLAAALRARRGV
ncbi:MAG: recombination protein RecR [Rhodospirillaceae bacterium]|nr:recombination protein RecR [Rhodospirillaceae bacterium]